MGYKDDERILNIDLMKAPYPFDNNFFDRIYLLHTIEHIPDNLHASLLAELRRILKDTGELVIAYPEFKKVAMHYINNTNEDRDFWKATIFGRAQSEWDRHKALMDTEVFTVFAAQQGLAVAVATPEKDQEFNTIVVLVKCEPTLTYEDLIGREFSSVAIRPGTKATKPKLRK